MDRVWITNGSTSVAPVVNPLAAACHDDYVPTDIYVLDNPVISDVTDAATLLMKTVVTAHGGSEPSITVETIADERDFQAIIEYLKTALEASTHCLVPLITNIGQKSAKSCPCSQIRSSCS